MQTLISEWRTSEVITIVVWFTDHGLYLANPTDLATPVTTNGLIIHSRVTADDCNTAYSVQASV